MEKMIECKNVVFKYSTGEEGIEKLAIDELNLEVSKGEFLVILGHNGSGKSTVAKHMNALLTPTEGTVIVNGLDTGDENNIWDNNDGKNYIFNLEKVQTELLVLDDEPVSLGSARKLRKSYLWSKKVRLAVYKLITYLPKLISGNYKRKMPNANS